MAPQLRLVVLGATVLAAMLAGVALLSGGGPRPTPSPSPASSVPPSAAPSAFACFGDTTGCAGALGAGPTHTKHFALPFTFQASAGWTNGRDIPRTYGLEFSGVSTDAVTPIQVMTMIAIADQKPDRCQPVAKTGVGSSVDDLIAYVRQHPGLVAAEPVPASLDGFEGQQVDFTIAPTWGLICPDVDRVIPAVLMLTDTGTPPGRAIAYLSDRRVRWIVLDVRGETVIVEYVESAVAPNFEAKVAPAQALVDTIHFLPGG
jgi:hypothetical protein